MVVAIVFIVLIVFIILWVALSSNYSPRAGLEGLGLSSGREITERREALEAEDLAEMMAARNARRRARGEAEVSAEEYEMQIMTEVRQQRMQAMKAAEQARQEEQGRAEADAEITEMLEATNARRRAKGLPERTREDLEREFGGGS